MTMIILSSISSAYSLCEHIERFFTLLPAFNSRFDLILMAVGGCRMNHECEELEIKRLN